MATTTTSMWCEGCGQAASGAFCGECGSKLVEKEVEAPAAAPPAKKPAATLSIFEQNAMRSQKETSSVTQQKDHKFGGATKVEKKNVYVGTFGDERRKAAQAESRPQDHSRFQSKPTTGYVGSFGDEQRKKAQAAARPNTYNKFGGAGGGGGSTYVGTFGEEQRKKAQAESRPQNSARFQSKPNQGYVGTFGEDQRKKAQAESRPQNSTRFQSKPNQGYVGTFGDDRRKEAQAAASGANRAKDNIVMSKEKKCEGAMDITTASALENQKAASEANRASDKVVKSSTGTGEAPKIGESAEAPKSFRCNACDEEREFAKFCSTCGGPITEA